jgi:hypothetical protein
MDCKHEFVGTGYSLYPVKDGLKICKNCLKTTDEIALEAKLAEAQEKIVVLCFAVEQLKCCGNCKWWNINDAVEGYCDHPESEMPDIVRKRMYKCDKWEQA